MEGKINVTGNLSNPWWLAKRQFIILVPRLSIIMPSDQVLNILSLDTSTPRGSMALLRGREVVAELRLLSSETHSARLLNCLTFLLGSVAWELKQLDLVAVGIGPGSFTGIRIGLSTALGLAQVLSCPLAGISGLEALAHEIAYLEGRLGIVMDAQRLQVYYAEYLAKNGRLRVVRKPALWFPQELEAQLRGRRLYLAGDGAVRYAKELRISKSGRRRLVELDIFLAAGIARVALTQKRRWRSGEFLTVEPLYIRQPDALKRKGTPA